MSDTLVPERHAPFEGSIQVLDRSGFGMITLRGDLGSPKLAQAVKAVTGTAVPEVGKCNLSGDWSVAWMSPDELLLTMPRADLAGALGKINTTLTGEHFLAVEVSDARSSFWLEGSAVREVIAKLAPVDMTPEAFPIGTFRRTRLAQTPVAIWMRDAEVVELICFCSVSDYVYAALCRAAAPGSEVGYY